MAHLGNNKNTIRQNFKLKRLNLASEHVRKYSELITEKFFEDFNIEGVNTIHIYLSIPDKNEVDTSMIIEDLKTRFPGIKLIHPSNKQDSNVRLDDTMYIDMIVVPLICFDRKGYRLGFGGGFYDRLIRQAKEKNPQCVTVGLAYEASQCPTSLPIEPHDQKLDYVITEKKVYKFS